MPDYGAAQSGGLTVLYPGDAMELFASESPDAPQASMVFARGQSAVETDAGSTFQTEFASSPTSVVEILGSNQMPGLDFTLADWAVLYTSTDKISDSYTDTGRWAYYCAYLASQSGGGAVTVLVQR